MNQIIKTYDQYFKSIINERKQNLSKNDLDIIDVSFRDDGLKSRKSGYITFQEIDQDEITETWTMYPNGKITFGHFYPVDLQRLLMQEIKRFIKSHPNLKESRNLSKNIPDERQSKILLDNVKDCHELGLVLDKVHNRTLNFNGRKDFNILVAEIDRRTYSGYGGECLNIIEKEIKRNANLREWTHWRMFCKEVDKRFVK